MLKFLPCILSSVLLNSFAQIFIRKGMLSLGEIPTQMKQLFYFVLDACINIYLIIGMSCYAISILLWMYVLGKVEVSFAYPFQSLGYVVAAGIAFYTLGEPLSSMKVAGIAIICVGVFVLSFSTK